MSERKEYDFNNIIRQIIKKSLFTERQIEFLLHQKNITKTRFEITKGAYYRQIGQSRDKLSRFYYTMVLLRELDVILLDDVDVISRLSEQISVIKNSDISSEKEEEVMIMMDKVIKKLCNV